MIAAIVCLIMNLYVIYKSVKFLNIQRKIRANGKTTFGKVMDYKTYKYNMMFKGALIPVFSFSPDGHQWITSVPKHSVIAELIPYELQKSYKVTYIVDNPQELIVENKFETIVPIAFSVLGTVYGIWFFTRYLPGAIG